MKFSEKIRSFFAGPSLVSDDFFDELSDLLVEGDLGAQQAYEISGLLREQCRKEKVSSPEDARGRLAVLLEDILKGIPAFSPALLPDRQAVILLLGVNGVGKTTTAAKLAACLHEDGRKPILAAADTFRAAAVDQLKIHGQRLGVRVVAHQQGGDPAAVVFDSIEAAAEKGVVIADTAGRMHTKSALVDELRKIDRIVETKAAAAQYIKYLVLDATTGRNALAQAEIFCEAVSPQAAIVTKYDSTARGGIVFSLAAELRLPVAYLCTGEKYGDISVFDAHRFAEDFAGVA